jgi:uracil-DNA glycosylase family 4
VCVGYDGPDYPKLLIVGEAPGKQEDAEGRPFIGPAGKLLEELIEKVKIPIADVGFANIVRCIPWAAGNNKVRPPTNEEIEQCEGWLIADLEAVGPETLIMPVGNTALTYFTGRKKITQARGNIYEFKIEAYEQPFEIMPTVHPASVLYDPHGPKGQFYYSAIMEDLSKAAEKIYGTTALPTDQYELIYDVEQLAEVVDAMLKRYHSRVELGGTGACVCVDVETGPDGYGLKPFSNEGFVISIGFTDEIGKAWVIPLHHDDSPFLDDAAEMSAIRAQMQRLFDTVPVVNHNIKFDYHWLREKCDLIIQHVAGDTMLQSWTLYNKLELHSLEYLSAKCLGIPHHKKEMEEALAALPDGMKDMSHVPLDTLLRYNGADVDVTLQLYFYFCAELEKLELHEVDQWYMTDAVEPIADMERNGVALDLPIFEVVNAEYEAELAELTEWFVERGFPEEVAKFNVDKKGEPRPFKLSSTNVIKALLYDVIGLEVTNKTKTGQPATDKDTVTEKRIKLQEHIENGPEEWVEWAQDATDAIDRITEHKRISKLYDTYIKPIPTLVSGDGLLHPTYGIRTTGTGRFVGGTFLTIPRKSAVKTAFVSRWRDTGLILNADYSQMELRVLAMLSGDQSLIDAFAAGKDIHRATAAIINKIAEDDVTDEQRSDAKRGNFGVVYGQTPHGMSKKHGITVAHAESIINGLLNAYPGVREFQQRMEVEAKTYGMVYTPTGHRRLLPYAQKTKTKKNREDVENALRAATNTPIQGGASDIAEQALMRLWQIQNDSDGELYDYQSLMFGFVHDNILYDVFQGELYTLIGVLGNEMENWPPEIFKDWLTVPLKVDFEVGPSWGQMVSAELTPDPGLLVLDGSADTFDAILERTVLWDAPPEINIEEEYADRDGKPQVRATMYFANH